MPYFACELCKQGFYEPRRSHAYYCPTCSKQKRTINCLVCGKAFTVGIRNTRTETCSSDCAEKLKDRREKQRAEELTPCLYSTRQRGAVDKYSFGVHNTDDNESRG